MENKLDKVKILNALKADFKAAKELRSELDTKIHKWKREYNAEPYGNEVEGRSTLVSRDIKMAFTRSFRTFRICSGYYKSKSGNP